MMSSSRRAALLEGKGFLQWDENGFISDIVSMSLNSITFDGHGGAKTAERWNVKHRIRDAEEAPMARSGRWKTRALAP